jgi:hypothetical protein
MPDDKIQLDKQFLRRLAQVLYVLERPVTYGQERFYQEKAGVYHRSIEAMLGEKIRLEDEGD